MKTHSLCPVCYRHIEAELFERGGAVRMRKTCPEHGTMEAVIENDVGFFQRIQANRGRFAEHQEVVVLDVTDKCNLKCSHCYHVPDNGSPNKPIEAVLGEVGMTPESFSVILGGAEPTIRRDIAELAAKIGDQGRPVGMLSNGVLFADEALAAQVAPRLNGYVLIGLNHRAYHGEKIHDRQLAGLRHLRRHGVRPMLGYTAEHGELPDILREALQLFGEGVISLVRLRFGAGIGRHPGLPALTLSDHIEALRQVCRGLHLDFQVVADADNTIYHQMALVAGMPVRVIQWPDEHNIVMGELVRAPWAKFIDGPISNFCHQIVLRDGFVHKKLPKLDVVPQPYTLQHFMQQRAGVGKPLGLNVSSPAAKRLDCGNAHYVEALGAVTVANLHGVLSPAQRDAVARFWLESGAIPDEREALRRADEVVHLGFDADGNIVAVNTCYVATLNIGGGPMPYWCYRIFVHPRARSVRLSLGLFRLTARHFEQAFREESGPHGIVMHLENPKFYRRSGRRALGSVGIKPIGKDARGIEVWAYEF